MATQVLQKVVVDQVGIAWRLARARLEGLSDDGFWEPVEGCWSLRPKDRLVTGPMAYPVPGDWWFHGDNVQPAADPPPVTTVAWLIAHMILGTWNWNDTIAGRPVAPEPAFPETPGGPSNCGPR